MEYTVAQLSKLAKVSIRTLHYYDEIGLLEPSFIKENGYRYYEKKALIKLQQILFFRELGFELEYITEILHSPKFNIKKALRNCRELLELKKQKIEQLLSTIDYTEKNLTKRHLNTEKLFQAFEETNFENQKNLLMKKFE